MNYEIEKDFFKTLFHLDVVPEVLGQCCYDVEHENGCTGGLIDVAQNHLNEGKPVVIKFFGQISLGSVGYPYDNIVVYLPGMKIDKNLILETQKKKKASIKIAKYLKFDYGFVFITKKNGEMIIPGVYCDVYNTLIFGDDKPTINQKVLNMLKEIEQNGKDITLWTGGDASEFYKIVKKFGIEWPIHSKSDYYQQKVEIAIDDESENFLYDRYKIKAEKFIHI